MGVIRIKSFHHSSGQGLELKVNEFLADLDARGATVTDIKYVTNGEARITAFVHYEEHY